MNLCYDVVIIGSGIAGLSALLGLPPGFRVALLSPGNPLATGSSWRAQGGVAVALSPMDSPWLHALDTLRASAYVADEKAVRLLVEEGPERVKELLSQGWGFDRDEHGELVRGLEAGHSRPRVLHYGDRTGKMMMSRLWALAQSRELTDVFSRRAVQLLGSPSGVEGVLLDDQTVLRSPRVILASGGFAGLFEATTTGREVCGEGILLASELGARVADLEFVQFHPTALDDPEIKGGSLPLLTEALRGAGAVLRDSWGRRFVNELKTRDEVARAIAFERRRGPVLLDVRPVERLVERFPEAAVHLHRLAGGTGLLPVRPAAHYTMGGVVTDLDGATAVAGLYACGEVASVGIHGANRLASNSLLEGLVFGSRAGRHAGSSLRASTKPSLHQGPLLKAVPDLTQFRSRFEQACGVVRTGCGLEEFLDWLERQHDSGPVRLAEMVARAALERRQSLGSHFRADAETVGDRVA